MTAHKKTNIAHENGKPCSEGAMDLLRATLSPSDGVVFYAAITAEHVAEGYANDDSELARHTMRLAYALGKGLDATLHARGVCRACMARALAEKGRGPKLIAEMFGVKVVVVTEDDKRDDSQIVDEAMAEAEHTAADKDDSAARATADILSRFSSNTRH